MIKQRPVTSQKASRVDALRKLVSDSKSVAVVDYTGLNVAQATQLRQDIKAAGGEMKVEKNTLFKIALKDLGSNIQDLKGLSAFVFAKSDEIAPLKIVADFIKKNTLLSFKAGLMGDNILSSAEVTALANTPARDTSVGKLLFLLSFHTSQLVRTLDAITKKEVTN